MKRQFTIICCSIALFTYCGLTNTCNAMKHPRNEQPGRDRDPRENEDLRRMNRDQKNKKTHQHDGRDVPRPPEGQAPMQDN